MTQVLVRGIMPWNQGIGERGPDPEQGQLNMDVLGSSSNCNPKWNQFLGTLDDGYHTLVTIAFKVWYSLNKPEEIETYSEDLIQESIIQVYTNIDAWDTKRNSVSWASVVMKNSMIRGMDTVSDDKVMDPHDIQEIVPDTGTKRAEMIDYVYQRAKPQERRAMYKVLFGIELTRNEYRHWNRLKERLLSSPEFKELVAA